MPSRPRHSRRDVASLSLRLDAVRRRSRGLGARDDAALVDPCRASGALIPWHTALVPSRDAQWIIGLMVGAIITVASPLGSTLRSQMQKQRQLMIDQMCQAIQRVEDRLRAAKFGWAEVEHQVLALERFNLRAPPTVKPPSRDGRLKSTPSPNQEEESRFGTALRPEAATRAPAAQPPELQAYWSRSRPAPPGPGLAAACSRSGWATRARERAGGRRSAERPIRRGPCQLRVQAIRALAGRGPRSRRHQ